LFAQKGFGPRSYLSNAIQSPRAIERPLRVIWQVIVSEFCCKGRETAGLFEFRGERYLVLTKKAEERRKVVRGSICNRPQGKNSFQHLLYCLLGMEADHFVRRRRVGKKLLQCELIVLRLAK
jgi:hypothetical protein